MKQNGKFDSTTIWNENNSAHIYNSCKSLEQIFQESHKGQIKGLIEEKFNSCKFWPKYDKMELKL